MDILDYYIQSHSQEQLANIEAALMAPSENSGSSNITDKSVIGRAPTLHLGKRLQTTRTELSSLSLALAGNIETKADLTITFAPTGPWEISRLNLLTDHDSGKLELYVVHPDGLQVKVEDIPADRDYGRIVDALIKTPRYVLANIPAGSWFLLSCWDDLVTASFDKH